MSYRDLRNFSETMRALGYPRAISLESFREPNFPLVEEIVRWLATRLDPDASLAGGSATVEQRVALIRDATGFFVSRGNVRVSGRRLYGADRWAARELARVAALMTQHAPPGDSSHGTHGPPPLTPAAYDVGARLSEIKQARLLSTEITAQGTFLYDLLANEPDYKIIREKALSRPLDLSAMEASLRRALDAAQERVSAARDQIENVAVSEAALDAKLERRRAELTRAEKRLHTVQKIKPAYQSELTSLESEIESLWSVYVLRYRCVEALKHRLAVLETAQTEAAAEQQTAIMQLIYKYETEDVLGKLTDSEGETSSDGLGEPPRNLTRPTTRLRIKTAGTGSGAGAESRRTFGNMGAVARDSLEDELDLSDDDIEDNVLYGNDVEQIPSRWSRSGVNGTGGSDRTSGSRRPRPATRTIQTDDEDEDLVADEGRPGAGDSLESSDESELRAVSGAGRTSAALSDNEF